MDPRSPRGAVRQFPCASVFCCLNNVDISYTDKLFHFGLEYKFLSLATCSKCSVSLMRLPVTGVRSGDPFQRGGDRCVCTALAPEHLLSPQHTLQGRHCFPPPSLHLQHVVCRLLGTRTLQDEHLPSVCANLSCFRLSSSFPSRCSCAQGILGYHEPPRPTFHTPGQIPRIPSPSHHLLLPPGSTSCSLKPPPPNSWPRLDPASVWYSFVT